MEEMILFYFSLYSVWNLLFNSRKRGQERDFAPESEDELDPGLRVACGCAQSRERQTSRWLSWSHSAAAHFFSQVLFSYIYSIRNFRYFFWQQILELKKCVFGNVLEKLIFIETKIIRIFKLKFQRRTKTYQIWRISRP